MNRLCFLFPDVERVRSAVGALHATNIPDSDIMVVARRDTPLVGLPSANIEASDAIPAFKRGLVGGTVIGVAAGFIILLFPALRDYFGVMSIVWFALIGAVVGGLGALFAGTALFSTRLEPFREDIESGKVLLMADVAEDRSDEVEDLVKSSFPEATFVGLEPPAPVVPAPSTDDKGS